MIAMRLSAVDTLFFRDGTPFASEGTSQADVGGMFPPTPESVAGALRAALARCNGWDGKERRWPPSLNPVLGDGPDDLGSLMFEGPFVLEDGVPLVPVPRHVVGLTEGEKWRPAALLAPGSPVACDLGEAVRLPGVVGDASRVEPAKLKPGTGWWMRLDALPSVLRGGLPPGGALVPQECLWRVERRIGLGRDFERRTAEEGKLYSARFVRPSARVAIGARVSGVPGEWRLPLGLLIPLGGEGRFVECEPWEPGAALSVPEMPVRDAFSTGRVMVVALTPLVLPDAVVRGAAPIPELGGARVLSACLDRPQRIGGWNSLARAPSPTRSVVPAGSVLFCELERGSRLATMEWPRDRLPRIGERIAHGYGAVAIGVWPEA